MGQVKVNTTLMTLDSRFGLNGKLVRLKSGLNWTIIFF